MVLPFIPAVTAAVKFVFTSQSFLASAVRFVGATLISLALSGAKGPRLSDLKVQGSSYGVPIPRLYGRNVRVAPNIIDKTDFNETSKKKGKILGLGGTRVYSYDVGLICLIAEGLQSADAIAKIWMEGKLVFDRDAGTGAPVTVGGTGLEWSKSNNTHSLFDKLRVYPGDGSQTVDPLTQELHPGSTLAYRHTFYAVITKLQLQQFGNRVPNIEFEVEPRIQKLAPILTDFAEAAGTQIVTDTSLKDTDVRGYIVANDGNVWNAIEPVSGVFNFDIIAFASQLRAVERGKFLKLTIPEEDLAARQVGGSVASTKDITREDPNEWPDEVTVSYLDKDRDYQPNSQRAFRNQGYSTSKVNIEVPIVLTATEAVNVAYRTLSESLAGGNSDTFYVSEKYRELQSGDNIGITIAGNVEPFRVVEVTASPNGQIELRGFYLNALAYSTDLVGTIGDFTPEQLVLVGATQFQPIDASIISDADDDTGFYVSYDNEETGWVGVDLSRALGTGSPLSYTFVDETALDIPIGDCDTTLSDGPTDVWDDESTLTITLTGNSALSSLTKAEIEQNGGNLAWIGAANGQNGEWVHFATATLVSGSTYIISNLLRGRYGTEFATGAHGANERFVLTDVDAPNRLDFGPSDWNLARTYKPVSISNDIEDTAAQEFTNTGEGKRPLSAVHVKGTRNSANNDILITWTPRTRLETPRLGGGPVPIGEAVESYEVDVLDGASNVVRTLIASTPQVNYTAAEQTADGLTPGAFHTVDVYQISDVRGRGRPRRSVI